jgi:hypothetical protein
MRGDVGAQVRLSDAHGASETMGREVTRLDPPPNTALGDAQKVRDVANGEKPRLDLSCALCLSSDPPCALREDRSWCELGQRGEPSNGIVMEDD